MMFEEILNWAPGNEDIFEDLCDNIKKGCVIPFVGAGLSAPLFPLWRGVLEKLTDKLSSEENRKAVIDILNSSEPDAYTRAADKLIELRSEANVFKDILRITNEDKIDDAGLREMAVYLLPFLFHDKPVITTNYDRVLEHVFRMGDAEYDHVLGPDSDLSVMIGQQNLHCLFKIHGDIGRKMLDWRKLILTGKSYEKAYKPGSELVNTLKNFYRGKVILFLGSSLKYDRTLEILKQVADETMISHFAILPCGKEKLDEEALFFGNRKIQAFFYEPTHHEAVKKVLEELLRRTDLDSYQRYMAFPNEEEHESQKRIDPEAELIKTYIKAQKELIEETVKSVKGDDIPKANGIVEILGKLNGILNKR